jgi:hypothetical protein
MKILTFLFPPSFLLIETSKNHFFFLFLFLWNFANNEKADCDVQGIKTISLNL